jgi:NAD(P)-dependent dehydrogenase (short-subunit alcohol dehydrogenase family)
MTIRLEDSVAVITGAGSGIGRASAHSFARRGARIVVTDIDGGRARAVADELGDQAVATACDVASLADFEAVRDLALDRFGRVDLVMNNVGVLAVGPVESIPLEAWQRAIDLNLLSVVRSNLVFLPILLAQGSGHIVITASTAGLLPYGFDRLPYTMWPEPWARRIGVSCFCPAGVATNILEQMTFYGEPAPPLAPPLPIITAEAAGELVAQGVEDGLFLILSAPEVVGEMQRQAADVDAYLESFGPGAP